MARVFGRDVRAVCDDDDDTDDADADSGGRCSVDVSSPSMNNDDA